MGTEAELIATFARVMNAVLEHDGIAPQDRARHLAELIEEPEQDVARWLAGQTMPGMFEIVQVCKALDISVDELSGSKPLDLDCRDFLLAYRRNPPERQRLIQRAMFRMMPANRTPVLNG